MPEFPILQPFEKQIGWIYAIAAIGVTSLGLGTEVYHNYLKGVNELNWFLLLSLLFLYMSGMCLSVIRQVKPMFIPSIFGSILGCFLILQKIYY